MFPALVSQMVIALKDSALGYQIGYIELVRSGQQSASYHRNLFAALVVVGVIMIIINFGLTSFATWLDKRLRTRGSGGGSGNGVGKSSASPPIDTDMLEGVPGVDDMTTFGGEGKQA